MNRAPQGFWQWQELVRGHGSFWLASDDQKPCWRSGAFYQTLVWAGESADGVRNNRKGQSYGRFAPEFPGCAGLEIF